MKKSVLIALIVAAACVVTGALVGMIGFALGGFELSAPDTETLVTREYTETRDFTCIFVDAAAADVDFEPSKDGTCRVVCTDRERIVYTVEVVEDTLTIRYSDGSKWYEDLVSISIGDPTVTVYLPKETYRSLRVDTSSGDIGVSNRYTFEEDVTLTSSSGTITFAASVGGNTAVKASSGDVHVVNADMGPMTAETSSGKIRLEQVKAAGAVHLTTSSGGVGLEKTTCGSLSVTASSGDMTADELTVVESLRINATSGTTSLNAVTCADLYTQSSSGKVELTDLIASGHIRVHTSSGGVRFTRSDAATLVIETTSGSVKGSLLTSKIFHTDTSSGSVDVPVSTEGGLCEVKTSSGDIRFTIGE